LVANTWAVVNARAIHIASSVTSVRVGRVVEGVAHTIWFRGAEGLTRILRVHMVLVPAIDVVMPSGRLNTATHEAAAVPVSCYIWA
jgi:hypothetical protein